MDTAAVELFKKILEVQEKDSNKIILYFIIIIIASIFSIVINLIIQIILNSKVYKYDIRKMKNERRLKLIEDLYSCLSNISDNLLSSKPDVILKKVTQIQKWSANKKIVLGKTIYTNTNEILDYFYIVLSDKKSRNIRIENDLFNKYIKGYDSL